MTYVVFSPYWNIPPNILRDETLPRVAQRSGLPAAQQHRGRRHERQGRRGRSVGHRLVGRGSATKGLRFRQRPGPDNALGLVKFIFPNHFNVYLHDTPGDRLFFKEHAHAQSWLHPRRGAGGARASTCCGDQPEWTGRRIRAAMDAGRGQTVTLKQPLPVHIGYWTAWVEPDGKTVTFTDDPYGIDPKHLRAA